MHVLSKGTIYSSRCRALSLLAHAIRRVVSGGGITAYDRVRARSVDCLWRLVGETIRAATSFNLSD